MINLGMIGAKPLLAVTPSAWAPTDEASLLWWLDAADLATITKDGSNQVTAWNNKAAPDIGDLVQATPANAPVWSATGLNSRPCCNFSTTSRMLGNFAHVGPDTQIVAAVSLNVASAASGVAISFAPTGVSSGADGGWNALRRSASNEQADMLLNTAVRGVQSITYDVAFTWSSQLIATACATRKDGGSAVSAPGLTITTDFDLVALNSGITSAGANGSVRTQSKIGAILAFSSVDGTLRQKAEGYLAHRWGITLAAGHPYLGAPP